MHRYILIYYYLIDAISDESMMNMAVIWARGFVNDELIYLYSYNQYR